MSISTAAAAAGVLRILQVLEVAADAKPIIAKLKASAVKGATFEELLEEARSYAVASETDAQAAINKA